jgi:hypothetical protein
MHLQKVVLPKILSLSISMHPNGFTRQIPKHPSKAPTNAKTLRRRVTDIGRDPVFRPAASINIPRHRRTDQYDSPSQLRLKRRSATPDHKRPRKIAKTDENTSADASRESDAPATDIDGFPSFKPVDQSLDGGRNSSAEPPSSDDDFSDSDEVLSGSLFNDRELLERELPVRNAQVCQIPFHYE